jgi:hypothetical protein
VDGAGIIAEVIGLFVLVLFEVAVFPAFDPILAESTAVFGPLGVAMRAVMWGGPPASLTAAIALAAKAGDF